VVVPAETEQDGPPGEVSLWQYVRPDCLARVCPATVDDDARTDDLLQLGRTDVPPTGEPVGGRVEVGPDRGLQLQLGDLDGDARPIVTGHLLVAPKRADVGGELDRLTVLAQPEAGQSVLDIVAAVDQFWHVSIPPGGDPQVLALPRAGRNR
jgi:hypothetical protein